MASPRWQGRLNADLATGAPVHYQRVPGSRQKYYNPADPTQPTVTENYVVRVYRPNLLANERQLIRERSREVRSHQAAVRRSVVATYTESGGNRRDTAAINRLVAELKYYQYQARARPIGDQARTDLLAADGPYAAALVALGRRLPTDNFPVGMSPAGHINNTVLPTLRAQQGSGSGGNPSVPGESS